GSHDLDRLAVAKLHPLPLRPGDDLAVDRNRNPPRAGAHPRAAHRVSEHRLIAELDRPSIQLDRHRSAPAAAKRAGSNASRSMPGSSPAISDAIASAVTGASRMPLR